MNKLLVLFTTNFPFGNGEPFLETELSYLCREFEKVTIITSNTKDREYREIPDNCDVLRIDLSYTSLLRLKSLVSIFKRVLWKEYSVIRSLDRLTFSRGVISTAIISLERGNRVASFIQDHFTDRLNETVFYSYWCDDAALGIAMAASKNNNIKGVSRIHGWDVYFERSAVGYLPFRSFISKHLKKIYSISQDGINYAVDRWKVDRSNFELARLGIENTHGRIDSDGSGIHQLVSCSSIIPLKRVELIAKALVKIEHLQIHWTHIGDGPMKSDLIDLMKELPSKITVELKGQLSNQQVYKTYETLRPHLFINVSTTEGIPVSIMEAMSFGIPVLATDVGGTHELVNNENGILMDAELTDEDLAKEIMDFLETQIEKRQEMSKKAFITWNESYNAKKNYSDFAVELKEL